MLSVTQKVSIFEIGVNDENESKFSKGWITESLGIEMLFLSPQRSENKAANVKQRTAGLRYGVASHLNSNEIPFFILSYYIFVSSFRFKGDMKRIGSLVLTE